MTALLVVNVTGAFAQNTFFSTKAGMVLVTAQKNAKGNIDGYTRMTIKNVEGSGNNMTISYVAEALNKNMKSASNPPMEIPLKVIIKDGVMILDMQEMFAGQMKDQQMKMEITGVPMELPGSLQPGQSLKDAEITMSIDLVITKMTTTVKMTDGKCLAIEDVTVPAGTFTCHKITQTATTTVMKKTIKTRTVSWMAPGVGTVKTESYDDKDKLTGSTELVEVK